MVAMAQAKYVRISPRKIRLIMDEVRGKDVGEALNILSFMPKKGARILKKLIESAVANAQENLNLDVDELRIAKLCADEGPILKRWRARALGRATMIRKRTSHLMVILEEIK
ncbi:MAG: 50S ribosomal protein L22 [Deltaproteobacteria bacterium]|nr:MAG: 50S ribosomal protein L22 [Deltaproteobacteria bacterium]